VAPIALAAKYQRELSAGTGYLPALIQSFGWAFVALAALSRFPVLRMPLAVVLAGLAGLSGLNNLRVANFDQPTVAMDRLLHRGVSAGLLDIVPERSTLYVPEKDLGFATTLYRDGFVTMESRFLDDSDRLYDVRIMPLPIRQECELVATFPPDDCAPTAGHGAWLRIRPTRAGGTVIATEVATEPFGAPARRIRVYAEGTDGPPLLTGQLPGGRPWSSRGISWRSIGDRIWEASPRPAPVADLIDDPASPMDFSTVIPPQEWVRRLGTRRVWP
jgi:hypothetical protein